MKSSALALIVLVGLTYSTVSLADSRCEPIYLERWFFGSGAGFLEKCGDQLRSWALKPTDVRWREETSHHGFGFTCSIEPSAQELGLLAQFPEYVASQRKPCPDEPEMQGRLLMFLDDSNAPSQEEEAIVWSAFGDPERPNSSLPRTTCPAFDASIGSLSGRATCLSDTQIIARFRDERLSFLLLFTQENKPLAALKAKVQMILSTQFTIERGTGDASLLRWMRP